MPHNFTKEYIAGWVKPLPDKARAELEHRWPQLPVDQIGQKFGDYLILKAARDGQPEPDEIAKQFDDFQKQVAALLIAAQPIAGNNIGSLIRQASGEYHEALDDLVRSLEILQLTLPRARRHLPTGHAVSPRHNLVFWLAGIVQEAGLKADKRPNGPLCQITELLLKAIEEPVSNAVEIVKPVLRAMKESARKQA